MKSEDLVVELYKEIKPEDIKKASEEGNLLMYFNSVVKKIFPSTNLEWKEKKKEEPKKRIKESELLDSVRIGDN